MIKARIGAFFEKLRQKMAALKQRAAEVSAVKKWILGSAAVVLVLILALILLLTVSSPPRETGEPEEREESEQAEATELAEDQTATEPQPVGIPATMGTVTADGVSICKDAGFVVDVEEYYAAGDRVEIHETKDVNGTLWGYTGKGWIQMGSVRMDDVPPAGDGTGEAELVSSGSYAVLGYGVVDLGTLNVRVGPGTDYTKVREIAQGIRYAYYEEYEGWVRIVDGWVSTEYFYVEGTTAEDATDATVTTNNLNIRSGPDTTYKRVGGYMEDETIQILAVVGGWGYTEKGWVSMMYVELPEPVYTTGTATVTIGLNIRQEPDPNSEKVDVYTEGDRITVLEVKDGWGKTDKGWINLMYVQYD
jgi:uncharacterized protein YraI